MFTGIVQTMGAVTKKTLHDRGATFAITADDFSSALRPGDSVAVNGVCHTVETCDANGFTVTSVGETLSVTTMSGLESGAVVNLEQAATLETALGGHLVQGHVDGVGRVVSFEASGEDQLLLVDVPAAVVPVLVPRGSIAIDGVSLTVADVIGESRVRITVVPHTMSHTIIGEYVAGTDVNVEADMIGKYVQRYVARIGASDHQA